MWVRALLLTASGCFAVAGLAVLQDPVSMESVLGVPTATPRGRVAVRGFYGGTQIGLAMFLLFASLKPRWYPASAACLTLVMGGLFVGRTTGVISTGITDDGELTLVMANFVGAILAALTWWIAQAQEGS